MYKEIIPIHKSAFAIASTHRKPSRKHLLGIHPRNTLHTVPAIQQFAIVETARDPLIHVVLTTISFGRLEPMTFLVVMTNE